MEIFLDFYSQINFQGINWSFLKANFLVSSKPQSSGFDYVREPSNTLLYSFWATGREMGKKVKGNWYYPALWKVGLFFVPVNLRKNYWHDNGNTLNFQVPGPHGHAAFTEISKLKPEEVALLDKTIELISDKSQIAQLLTGADIQLVIIGVAVLVVKILEYISIVSR